VDFRKGADGLAALAQEVLGQNPLSGVALVFRAKRADRKRCCGSLLSLFDAVYAAI
jgi:transposase